MPVAPTYPGVYIQELSSGVRTIVGVATSNAAFIGRTPRGPVNEATVVTSEADFERRFGGLSADMPLTYAVHDFYQNGGTTSIIVRLFSPDDGTGAAHFMVGDQTNGLNLEAASPGQWGNKLRVKVTLVNDDGLKKEAGLKPADTLFNLTVTDGSPGGAVERIMNLQVPKDPADDEKVVRRPDKVLKKESSLVRWRGDWPAAADNARKNLVVSEAEDVTSAKALASANAAKALQAAKNKLLAETTADAADAQKYQTAKKDLETAKAEEAALAARTSPPPTAAETAAATAKTTAATTALATAAGNAPGVDAADKALATATTTYTTALADADKAESDMGGTNSAALTAADYLGKPVDKTGIHALAAADLFNLLCIPPDRPNGDTPPEVYQAAMEFCAEHRAMLIVDPMGSWSANPVTAVQAAIDGLGGLGLTGPAARNAALYFPRVQGPDSLRGGRIETRVPCGIIAGVMARTDTDRGVWKSPAGLDASLTGITGFDVRLNDEDNGRLNPLGINALRNFPVYGNVAWGARTLRGADQLTDDYKYVPVRRLALYIEESLFRGTKWVVFEPNDEPLWAQIRLNVGVFMHNLFRQGAFQGSKPQDAYEVRCDEKTTTQSDIDRGIVNIIVKFAPLKPAEFVIITLQQIAGKLEV